MRPRYIVSFHSFLYCPIKKLKIEELNAAAGENTAAAEMVNEERRREELVAMLSKMCRSHNSY